MHQYADQNFLTDTVLSILANSRRRIVIRYLSDVDPVAQKELSHVIAEIEDCSQKSAYSSLDQSHCPTLKRAQIITQSNGTKTYSKGQHYDRAKLILDYCDQL